MTIPTEPICILLVDDHPAMRQGVATLLARKGFSISGEAENSIEALEQIKDRRPDLVLVDLSLKNESGLDLITALQHQGIAVLVYSMHEESYYIKRAFAAGALGYVSKSEVSHVLTEAIEAVRVGRRYVSPLAARSLADSIPSGTEATKPLSVQEEAIFRLLGRGEETARIAEMLNINTRTVHSYYNRIIVKLGLGGMKELRRLAISSSR